MHPLKSPSAAPFSRPFDVNRMREPVVDLTLVAEPPERAGLARLDGLIAIGALEAQLRIRREGREGLRVAGEVRARVTQTCVVTLDPFETEIVEPIDVHFLPEAEVAALAARPPDAGEAAGVPDLPDPIVGGRIDLGALAAEFLTLALDPYPRRPGATLADADAPQADEAAVVSPFAALGRLRSDPPADR